MRNEVWEKLNGFSKATQVATEPGGKPKKSGSRVHALWYNGERRTRYIEIVTGGNFRELRQDGLGLL